MGIISTFFGDESLDCVGDVLGVWCWETVGRAGREGRKREVARKRERGERVAEG